MITTYVQKNSTVQKVADSKAASLFDSSSQRESLQHKADMVNNAAQRAELQRSNNTGMPDNLKSGIDNLSGFSMDDVRVHYNSSKPATVQALAYTQGTDIHVAPGQEKHLPHEAWHVAQQMAGRVSPTTNINGMPVNDNAGLEHEADVMGEKAVQGVSKGATVQFMKPAGYNPDAKKSTSIGPFTNWDEFIAKKLQEWNIKWTKSLKEKDAKQKCDFKKKGDDTFNNVPKNCKDFLSKITTKILPKIPPANQSRMFDIIDKINTDIKTLESIRPENVPSESVNQGADENTETYNRTLFITRALFDAITNELFSLTQETDIEYKSIRKEIIRKGAEILRGYLYQLFLTGIDDNVIKALTAERTDMSSEVKDWKEIGEQLANEIIFLLSYIITFI